MVSIWHADSSLEIIFKFENKIQIGYFVPPTILLPLDPCSKCIAWKSSSGKRSIARSLLLTVAHIYLFLT